MQIIDVIFQEFWHDFNSDSILKEYKLDIYEICQNRCKLDRCNVMNMIYDHVWGNKYRLKYIKNMWYVR